MLKVNTNKAFSVLELSITLAIISLIIAAIVAGQSIVRQQELSQVITDISTITSAYKQFKDVYSNSLPGDYYNATGKFGSTATDNGNGNGYLATSVAVSGTVCAVTGNANEELMFWQHLQLAGLISGSYDCKTTGAGGLMATRMKYGFYQAHKSIAATGAATKRLNIQVSKSDGGGLFSTFDASKIDNKFDDGMPTIATAKTIAASDGTGEAAGNCVKTSPSPYTYNTTNAAGTPCALYFYIE